MAVLFVFILYEHANRKDEDYSRNGLKSISS